MTKKPKSSAPPGDALTLTQTVVLIGMMGAGKSSIGARLADRYGLDFYDSDKEIEQAANMSIAEIFETHGEAYFRDGERRVIERLLNQPPMILAAGGGAFMNDETRRMIEQNTTTVWLEIDKDEIIRRVSKHPGKRPLLGVDNLEETVTQMLEQRRPVYERADIIVQGGQGQHKKTVQAIAKELVSNHILVDKGEQADDE